MASGYILAEWKSVSKDSKYQRAFAALETEMLNKCEGEWAPKTFGALSPGPDQFGRTTILPGLFYNGAGVNFGGSWRQTTTALGHQLVISGNPAQGLTIPEDFKVAWIGLAFPNKMQELTEFRFQIGDKKYGRQEIEDLDAYNSPAMIFEEGYIIDEEQSFDLWAYIKSTQAGAGVHPPGPNTLPQYLHIVMLGAAYYRIVDKVLGNTGALIT